jgi:hypothetical protein
VVSRKPLAVLVCSLIINHQPNSPADYRWAIAFGGYNRGMRPLPAPDVPGKTEFERFNNAMRQVLSISKEELLRREAAEQKVREQKRKHRQENKKIKQVLKKLDR